jgi:hypothetical protein
MTDDETARTIEEAKPFSETARKFGEDVARALDEVDGDEDDGGDRWRTAALQIRYKDYQVGFSIYTGERNTEKVKTINGEPTYTNDAAMDRSLRMGAAYVGLRNNGTIYRAGLEGEPIRDFIQNNTHSFLRLLKGGSELPANFKKLEGRLNPYGRVGSPLSYPVLY